MISQAENPSNSPLWPRLTVLLTMALFVRALACTHLECISRDGVHFVTFARQLSIDPVAAMKATFKQPGMSFLLLGTSKMLGQQGGAIEPLGWIRAGQIISVTAGALACVLIFLLARLLFDSHVAILAGLLACFWPQGVELSIDVLSDVPHLALYLASLFWGIRASTGGRFIDAILCGVLAGAAYWMRQEALGALIASAIGLVCLSNISSRKRRLSLMLAMVACFAAVVTPQAIAVGHLMPNKDLWQMLMGRPQAASAASHWILAEAIPWWKAPGRMVEQWAFSGRYVLSSLVLVGLFLRSAPRAARRPATIVLIAIALQILAVQLRVKSYGEISSRYMLIPGALTIPWAAAGMFTLLSMIFQKSPDRARWTVALLLVLIFGPLAYCSERAINLEGKSFREAGEWLRAHANSRDKIAAHDRLEQLMFYAGVIMPDERWIHVSFAAPITDIQTQVREMHPRWFADVTNTRKWPPESDSNYFRDLPVALGPTAKEVFRSNVKDRTAIVWQLP